MNTILNLSFILKAYRESCLGGVWKPLAFAHFHWCCLFDDKATMTSNLNCVIYDWSVTDIEKFANHLLAHAIRFEGVGYVFNMIPLLVHSGWMWCVQLVDFCRLDDHITAVDITFLSQNFLTYHDLLWPVFTVFAQIWCVWNVIKQYALKMVCPGYPP